MSYYRHGQWHDDPPAPAEEPQPEIAEDALAQTDETVVDRSSDPREVEEEQAGGKRQFRSRGKADPRETDAKS